MKKLLIMASVAIFCLALELPALAKIEVGGRATLDWSYLSQSEERAQRGVRVGSAPRSDGFDDLNFIAPQPFNRLNAKYTSDDGVLVGFVEFWGGGKDDSSSTDAFIYYAYIQWQITPTNRITFGRQTTNFARFIPNQWVGHDVTSVVGVGFGNVNHGTSRNGIKGYWKISDMFGLVWGLWDPGTQDKNLAARLTPLGFIGFPVGVVGSGNPTGRAYREENRLPRIDLAVPIRFPWGRIEPSGTWTDIRYHNIRGGSDDSATAWGLSLGFEGSWGVFSIVGEGTWGQNLGVGSYRGAECAKLVSYQTSPGSGIFKLEDSDIFGWFLDVGFKFGINKIDFMYGQINYENKGNPGLAQSSDPDEFDFTSTFYGISWAISVAKGFTIRPELMFYDYDNSAIPGAIAGLNNITAPVAYNYTGIRPPGAGVKADGGKEWLLGLQFTLIF